MINRDFLYYSRYDVASTLKFAADETNTSYRVGFDGDVHDGEPLIAWTTQVFIGDTRQMWLRGDLITLGGEGGGGNVNKRVCKTIQEYLDIQDKDPNVLYLVEDEWGDNELPSIPDSGGGSGGGSIEDLNLASYNDIKNLFS